MSYTDLDSWESVTARKVDNVLDAVVTSVTALAADTHFAYIKGYIIKQNDNIFGRYLIEIHRFCYRKPRIVHVG